MAQLSQEAAMQLMGILAQVVSGAPDAQEVDLAEYFTPKAVPAKPKRRPKKESEAKRQARRLTPAMAKRRQRNVRLSATELVCKFETLKWLKPLKPYAYVVRNWVWVEAPTAVIRGDNTLIKRLKTMGFFLNTARSTNKLSVWCHAGGTGYCGRAAHDPREGGKHKI